METAADAPAVPARMDGQFDKFKAISEPIAGLFCSEGWGDGVVPPLAGEGGVAVSEAEEAAGLVLAGDEGGVAGAGGVEEDGAAEGLGVVFVFVVGGAGEGGA